MKILIEHGRLVDPHSDYDGIGDLAIAEGKIIACGRAPDGFVPEKRIDARGLIVCPGLIDMQARLREPGQAHKATIASEVRAAAAGGITSLCQPPDTSPVIDSPAVVELIHDKSERAHYRGVYPIGALTRKLHGEELSAMAALRQAGCIAVSQALRPFSHALVLRRALEYAATHDLLVMLRPDDAALRHKGCVHEGMMAARYGLPPIPESAETVAVAQYLELVRETGCPVHIGPLSCARSLELIADAKARGWPVTCDVAAHQLHLTEREICPFDSIYHVLPPLRAPEDREALCRGVASGVIDAVCSDHQPHDLDAKLGAFPETEPGMAGLETLLPLLWAIGQRDGIAATQLLARVTTQPARILGLPLGTLQPGARADVCLFAPEETWQPSAATWHSAGRNTPFWQQTLTSRVHYTLQAGRLIHSLAK